MNELVIMNNQQAVTTSLKIAEVFEKRHKDVLESIRTILVNLGSAEKSAGYFEESTYQDKQNKPRKMYYMNRDGFTLLGMGFTGTKAMDFKVEYIQAFNQMEKSLMNQTPTNMVEALTLALEQAKTIEVQNQVIGELKPKADYMDRILKSKSLVTITQIGKDYGMSAVALNRLLHDLGVQYKQSDQWLLYRKYHDKGYTSSETFVIEYDVMNGQDLVSMTTKWTQKGRLFLYDLLKSNDIIPMIERGS